LKEFLGEVFLIFIQKADRKDPTIFDHFMGRMGFVDTVDHLGWFKRRLHQPTYGKTINLFSILNTTDIDSMGNLAEHCLLRLFV
jgi:hypothetical protein